MARLKVVIDLAYYTQNNLFGFFSESSNFPARNLYSRSDSSQTNTRNRFLAQAVPAPTTTDTESAVGGSQRRTEKNRFSSGSLRQRPDRYPVGGSNRQQQFLYREVGNSAPTSQFQQRRRFDESAGRRLESPADQGTLDYG